MLSSTRLQLVQFAMVILPAVTEELKALWWYRPKCILLPHGSRAENISDFSAGEKSRSGVDVLWRAGLAASADTGMGEVGGSAQMAGSEISTPTMNTQGTSFGK